MLLPLIVALSLACALAVPTAQGSVVRALSLEDLVERAEHIVVAVPEEKQSRRHQDGRLIVTDVSLRVKQVLKGSAAPEGVLIATRLGGRLETIALQVPGEATFAIGERVLVFLRAMGTGSSGQLRVVGMSQGVMALTRQGTTTMVIPGAGHSALVEREPQSGKFKSGKAAVSAPTPLPDLLSQIRALVERDGSGKH